LLLVGNLTLLASNAYSSLSPIKLFKCFIRD